MKAILIILGFMVLIGVMVWDGRKQVGLIESCKKERIIGLSADYFSWEGIVRLSQTGKYQPKCL